MRIDMIETANVVRSVEVAARLVNGEEMDNEYFRIRPASPLRTTFAVSIISMRVTMHRGTLPESRKMG